MPPEPSESTATGGRVERRRAHTRRSLIEAARSLIAEGGLQRLKIGEITERADVGFGSFYNHFTDKDELVGVVIEFTVAEQAQRLEALAAGAEDPAEALALAHRALVRLAVADPAAGAVLVGLQSSHGLLDEVFGAGLRATVEAGVRSARFAVPDADAAVAASVGALAAAISRVLAGDGSEDLDSVAADEIHAELVLRIFGVDVADAATVAGRPFPG